MEEGVGSATERVDAEQLSRAHAMLAHLEVSSKQNVNVDAGRKLMFLKFLDWKSKIVASKYQNS